MTEEQALNLAKETLSLKDEQLLSKVFYHSNLSDSREQKKVDAYHSAILINTSNRLKESTDKIVQYSKKAETLNRIMGFFTFVIAVFTVVIAVLTFFLFSKESKPNDTGIPVHLNNTVPHESQANPNETDSNPH